MSQPELLVVNRSEEGGAQVIALSGELDLRSTGELEAALEAAGVDGGGHVCVDLSALNFIDSTGMAAVIRAHQQSLASDGAVAVVCALGTVRRTFELAGLMRLLTVVESRADALRALAQA